MNRQAKEILKLQDVAVGYKVHGGKIAQVFSDIDMSVPEGAFIALVGRNGIGKSTLLKTMARLQHHLSGTILFENENIDNIPSQQFAQRVSYVSTEIAGSSQLSVYDMVALGRIPYSNWFCTLDDIDTEKIEHALHLLGVSHLAAKHVHEISDGERQKVMIARAVAQDTDVIILDEPTAFLDIPSKHHIVSLLHSLNRKHNKTIIFSTHDIHTAINELDMIMLMTHSGIVQGAPEDIILNGTLAEAFDEHDVRFDMDNGTFSLKKNTCGNICLKGEGLHYKWTKHALERVGYNVTSVEEAIQVFVKQEKDKLCWEVIGKGTDIISDKTAPVCNGVPVKFESIYEMVESLK